MTAFIFDFDGTLVNSETAIYQCFVEITKQLAPNRIEIAKNILIGPPLRETAAEILGIDYRDKLNQFVELFIKLHDDEIVLKTQAFETVHETLSKLYKKKIPMAIATNKRSIPTIKLIKHFKWEKYFKSIECSDTTLKNQVKELMIKSIIKKNPEFINSYFVGDTVKDGKCAEKSNLKFIRANYGYGKKEKWKKVEIYESIDKPYDLIEKLKI